MWYETMAAERLGITYPIIQGPFGGGYSSTKLASAVSNAGGLGSFGAVALQPLEIFAVAEEIRSLTRKPFALNLWIPRRTEPAPDPVAPERYLGLLDRYFRELGLAPPILPDRFGQDYDAQIEAVLAARPPVFSFVFGIPEPAILSACRARGIVTLGTATTPEEAQALDRAGVDCIVASGFEAGGHRGSFLKPPESGLIGTFALVPQVVDRVQAPVIAAGGIADSRGIRAALALGAHGVQIGTAFLACAESGASPGHRAALFSAAASDTVLTKLFTGRLARNIRNRFIDEMQAHEEQLPPYPIAGWIAGQLHAAAVAQGRNDLISLSAGQAVGLLRMSSARALIEDLIAGVSAAANDRQSQNQNAVREGGRP